MKSSSNIRSGKRKIFFSIAVLCLLAILSEAHFSYVFCKPAPPEEKPGGIAERKTRIAIGSITVEDPRIVLRLGKGKKSERPFTEKLPSIGFAKITNATVDVFLKETKQGFQFSSADIDVRNFSPERGGQAIYSTNFLYRAAEKNAGLKGSSSGRVELASLTPMPAGKGIFKLALDQGAYGPASFDKVAADFSASVDKDRASVSINEFSMGGLKISTGGQPAIFKNVRLSGNALYEIDSKKLTVNSLKGNLPPIGQFTGNVNALMKKTIIAKAVIDTPSIDLASLKETAKAYIPAEYRDWSTQGKASVNTVLELSYSPESLNVKGAQQIKVTGAGLNSADGTKAVQGVQIVATLSAAYDSSRKKFEFDVSSQNSGGEFLWGTYYKDLSGNKTQAKAKGSFTFKGEKPFSLDAESDLFGAGFISVSGSGQIGSQSFAVNAKNISFEKAAAFLPEDYLKQKFPSLVGFKISGNSSLEINIRRKAPQTEMNGVITLKNTSFSIPAKDISVSGLNLNLPFDVGYPKAPPSGKAKQGLLEIKAIEKDKLTTQTIHLPIIIWGNKVRLPEGAKINVAEGDIIISGFAADDIFSKERKIVFGLKIDHVNLAPIERSFTTSPITGVINASYPKVVYAGDVLNAEGNTKISVFDGSIETGNISSERLFSASRKVAFEVLFKDLNLQKVTEKIAIGKMSGVIEGSIKNFEMEYGQPTRFILDIDSKKSKHSQSISVEAIQNISILGTGQGMMGVLNKGVLSFFKEYPYRKIGIHATLQNDAFVVRGKIHEGGKEYLVRRGWLRGVDVINQNPDNKISFKDMQERLKRIFEDRKAGQGPVVK